MDYIWSPWRMAYIQENKQDDGCVFCKAAQQQDNEHNLIIYRGKNAFVILNRYPYTSGHAMVVPNQHESDLTSLSSETRAEMMELVSKCMQVLRESYHPEGFNVGANIGYAAGAGIPQHVHIHIVPRWSGDTNFISTLSNTRVIPEALADTYWRIRETWEKLFPEG
ncbi:MAG: HIT domain-containing protein [Anaerolineales bacterium]|nr:HIT domain-containing protein [Anaerolineales bacterium]